MIPDNQTPHFVHAQLDLMKGRTTLVTHVRTNANLVPELKDVPFVQMTEKMMPQPAHVNKDSMKLEITVKPVTLTDVMLVPKQLTTVLSVNFLEKVMHQLVHVKMDIMKVLKEFVFYVLNNVKLVPPSLNVMNVPEPELKHQFVDVPMENTKILQLKAVFLVQLDVQLVPNNLITVPVVTPLWFKMFSLVLVKPEKFSIPKPTPVYPVMLTAKLVQEPLITVPPVLN